jgi:hypothetical protein
VIKDVKAAKKRLIGYLDKLKEIKETGETRNNEDFLHFCMFTDRDAINLLRQALNILDSKKPAK